MIMFFEKFPEITAWMSLRQDGNMKINYEKGESTNNNRNRFFERVGIPKERVYSAQLDHGTKIGIVNNLSLRIIRSTDALITSEKEIYISTTSADCFTVLLYDPIVKIIGVAHAGWAGVSEKIIPKVVSRMKKMGTRNKNIHVAVGPGICQKHFEFDRLAAGRYFRKYNNPFFISKSDKNRTRVHINLRKIVLNQLTGGINSIRRKNIEVINECTFCNSERFFSARRGDFHVEDDKKRSIMNMVTLIGMKDI